MNLNRTHSGLLLVLLTFACYAGTLSNDFLWDDKSLVVENPQIRNITYLSSIFTRDLMHQNDTGMAYFRPM